MHRLHFLAAGVALLAGGSAANAPCSVGPCVGRPDLTGDGVVYGADLGLLLGSWGAGSESP